MDLREFVFWSVAVAAAVVARFGGSWVGRRLGARHAVAWFGALVGFACAVILIHVVLSPGSVMRELKGPLATGCFIYGVVVATIIEIVLTVVEALIRSLKPTPEEKVADQPRPPQFSLAALLTVVVLISVLLSAYRMSVVPHLKWRRTYGRIRASVDSLAGRCPAGVPKAKWNDAVGWTHNGVGNCLSSMTFIKDMQRYHRFADELDERLQGEVDLATIDWIWDEFVEISYIGQSYSDKYRPTTR